MKIINAEEAIRFFRTYFKVDEDLVREWVTENNCKAAETGGFKAPVEEDDIYIFNDWNRYKGTAYEEGIDDETKIARLMDEVADLRKQISKLETENGELLLKLGILPF